MERYASRRLRGAAGSRLPKEDLRLRLIQVAGGNLAFEAKLREMIWHAYCEADRPYGPGEEGMFAWLAQQQHFMEP